ncbi:hypothetical protein HHK36_024157 [Tetracentron sinense]|uniref:FAS1 domain-containing protein n=1 Tax=Tetracentron sinense TaxID=13715 RepID=A0A835D402_TETSI|nr:hypothetical protein HHK36_024157 [Tetracentron sinense]
MERTIHDLRTDRRFDPKLFFLLSLREHIVPGMFSLDYLRSLAFGTKVETMSPGRCMTVTSADNFTKIFIGGVEITHPDLFNNGLIVVHGLQGFISHLSSFSCSLERMTSLSFPPQPSASDPTQTQTQSQSPSPLMRLMLRDAMLRLRNSGFTILSLALRVKYAELVNLQNMTLFALSDASIFSGGHAYVSNVRFHIVPNRLLMKADLEKLPAATSLATLERGERLVVTTAGGGSAPMRINYVPINGPDVMHNIKMVVHSVFLPFPHLHPAVGFGGVGDESSALNGTGENERVVVGPCAASDTGGCAVLPTSATTVKMEDHHGLSL